jgi:endonuclease/exonuclease/phosphatase (EEP) superfamily protein YafD
MKKPRLKDLFWAFVNVVALGLYGCSLVGLLGAWWWIFDLLSHFRVQYLLGLLAITLVYVIGKRWRFMIVTGVHLLPEYIQETDPDFVVLLEINQQWLDDLNMPALGYSYFQAVPREDNFGIAFFSKLPIDGGETRQFGRFDIPSMVTFLNIDDQPFTFVITHPVPPKNEKLTWHRNLQMNEVAEYIAGLEGKVILAADLNATSWSPHFRDWIRVSQLQDSRRGFGIQPTWPSHNWLLLVPIDHILTTSDIQVHHREIGPHIGSDHYPFIMDFSALDNNGDV